MITVEQGHSIAHEVAHRAVLPSDMAIGLRFGVAVMNDDGREVEVVRVMVEVTDAIGGETLVATKILENVELSYETFEVWLLGFVQGAMGILEAAELKAAEEEAAMNQDQSMRVH